MKDYKVVECSSKQEIEVVVVEMFNSGYQLYGSLIITNREYDGSFTTWYTQVMTRDLSEIPESISKEIEFCNDLI